MTTPNESPLPNEQRNSPMGSRRSRPPSAPDVFSEAAWIGRVIDDRYRVESLLGEGGMGAVFLAEHVKLGKKVALKIILPQFSGNGEVAERFAREAMASAKLEHPHVASALDFGTLKEGGAYLVMQYARGPSLRKSLGEARGWRYACDVGAQIADALSAAHAAGIVHRDLKPENVVLEARDDGSELVRVLDFGIARVLDPAEASGSVSKLTRVGTIIGTPGYMSPEQALGEPVDTRADLYALGVILWEITAGRELFTETDVTALVTRQLTTDPPLLRTILSDAPIELEDLVRRLLARDRNDRPQKAGEVRDVLRRLAFAAQVERMSQSSTSLQAPTPASAALSTHPREPGLGHAATITGGHVSQEPPPTFDAVKSQLRQQAQQTWTLTRTTAESLWTKARGEPRLLAAGAGTAIALALLALVFLAFLPGEPARVEPVVVQPLRAAEQTRPVRVEERAPVAPIAPGVDLPGPRTADLPTIPTTVSADFETLLREEARARRRGAAERLLSMPEDAMPPVVHLTAAFEDESGCTERRDILAALVALGDPRVLPLLERTRDAPRRGCGFLGTQDCYRCLRTPLRNAIEALQPP